MNNDAWLVVQTLFTTIWSFFNGWHIPGTSITPAAVFAFLLIASLIVRLMMRLFSGENIDSGGK